MSTTHGHLNGRDRASKMKLYSVYTASHRVLAEHWFLSSLQDDYDVQLRFHEVVGRGQYLDPDWTQAVLFKSETIINAIKENWGKRFAYSDVDIQFFKPTKERALQALKDNDIVCQRDVFGGLCTGFFIANANQRILDLWTATHEAVKKEKRDQLAFNRLIQKFEKIKWAYLPDEFFGAGSGFSSERPWLRRIGAKLKMMTPFQWEPGCELNIPETIVMHHANWTIGIENKIAQLQYVRDVVNNRNNEFIPDMVVQA